jgi:transcriptional regulator with PAS, ATPase and Fis domain
LFGHEKGAFTGATLQRKGRFELADGGTLFLDEISEIEPAMQVKLLRVLEERNFERVGGEESISVDIRIIAATNRDLSEYVKQGKFREDLFFRLNVVDIVLPSLRDRAGDIPLLAVRFLKEYAERNNRRVMGLTPAAMTLLSSYAWPGNVRELRNTLEKMVVLSQAEVLDVNEVPLNIRESVRHMKNHVTESVLVDGSLADTEKQKILAVLKKNHENRTRAAEELGISRRTLHRKLREYGVSEKGAIAD